MIRGIRILLVVLGMGGVTMSLSAEALISLYLQYPPQEILNSVEQEVEGEQHEITDKLESYVQTQRPSKIAEKMVEGGLRSKLVPTLGGFLVLYNGYRDFSNKDGFVQLPLRHTSPKLYVLITSKIELQTIMGNTIACPVTPQGAVNSTLPSLILKDDVPAEMYLFEKKKDNNNNIFWRVSKVNRPADGVINPITMVILTNPMNIFVQVGDYLTTDSPHMVLPAAIYVLGSQGNERIAMGALSSLDRFYEPIHINIHKADDTKNQKMILND